ncbi:MAG: hypothetical protein RRB13_14070 [bacterium]|nr:hypothetical protein [bacterium]
MRLLITAFSLLFLATATAQAGVREDLKQRMVRWDKLLSQAQSGLINSMMGEVEQAAQGLKETPHLPEAVQRALKAGMSEREASDFMKIDAFISTTGGDLAAAVAEEDIQRMLVYQGRLLNSCVQCHEIFRVKATQALEAAGMP